MPARRHVDIAPQSGCSIRLSTGETVQVIDLEGQQVADLWAFAVDGGIVDWLSVSQTRDITVRLFPTVGESFYSEQAVVLLSLLYLGSTIFPPVSQTPENRDMFCYHVTSGL
ncbi:DUF1989 domain-containing protein [Martelella soudanensis]|uniref:DUF1989 domain-containing protein n=1 Tax=unclassified Martelella TaxID=2629616 RepID=UPI0015DE8FD1|nr:MULTISPECIES: DUF1989 domain-containing protein [unclassified Martelella]